jgi:flagellar hook protein FlgE
MSLIGAFIAGVTGINAQSQKMGAISDNIANANTVGYKPTTVLFKTLVTRTDAPAVDATNGTGPTAGNGGAIPPNFAPGGVIPVPEARMDLQGVLTSSSSSTDLGITGRGFFPVVPSESLDSDGTFNKTTQVAVTRAGSFHMDVNGFLVNSNGFVLMGTASGNTLPSSLSKLVPVKFDPGPTVTIAGVATTQVALAANLPATDAIGDQETMTTGLFDALGNAYTLQIQLTKTGLGAWTAVASSVTQASNVTSPITATISSTPMSLTFDGNGQLTSGGTGSLGTFTLSNGQSLSPTFNFAGNGAITAVTQYGDRFAQSGAQQNGKTSGSRIGFQVDSGGIVSEVYSNGLILPKYQVPVVTYINPQGLDAESGNVWVETSLSGTASINASNTGGAGQITPSSLEQSSVDLGEEFSQMIIEQATYTANTKTITTADEMYQTLTQLR